jgi:hypothetical protein
LLRGRCKVTYFSMRPVAHGRAFATYKHPPCGRIVSTMPQISIFESTKHGLRTRQCVEKHGSSLSECAWYSSQTVPFPGCLISRTGGGSLEDRGLCDLQVVNRTVNFSQSGGCEFDIPKYDESYDSLLSAHRNWSVYRGNIPTVAPR